MNTNIGDSTDPFYRYVRPITIVENRKNMTIITNIENIAKALHTEVKYILYYIQLSKSASVSSKGEIKMILKKTEIEAIINSFISEYVLCKTCNYPELVIKREDNTLHFSCNACGTAVPIPENKFTKIIHKDHT